MNNLVTWLMANIDIPAIGFAVVMAIGLWVLAKTQANPTNGFDMADMLRDDTGKPSALRLGIFVSLAATTWGLMYHIIHTRGEVHDWLFLGYAAIWSGSAVASKAIEIYGGKKE
jgi:hypothetical protein